jgi:hypothetical protein
VIPRATRVTRGKVSVRLSIFIKTVAESGLKGRATPARKGALCWSTCSAKVRGDRDLAFMPDESRGRKWPRRGSVSRNRERELGLDRRETG